MRILIVEDQIRLADTLRDIMTAKRYFTDVSYDGESGFYNCMSGLYDVIILDVMLPKMDGFTILRKMRAEKIQTPVIMLTAKTETTDVVTGLDCGADYYLTKPFETQELLACIRAVTRRRGEISPEQESCGDLRLNLASYELSCGEHSIRLGLKEFEIMRLLLVNKSNILSKETILLKIWGTESEAEDNNVEVYISFLRKKLAFLKSETNIVTVRNCGYYLSEPGGK